MSVWPSLRIVVAILAIAGAGSACGGTPSTGSTLAPVATATTTAAAAAPSSAAAATPSAPIAAQPPAATLTAEGGDPVTGQLGSYTWAGSGSDSPWLPGAPMTVGSREPLTVALGGRVALVEWSARRVPAGTTSGTGAVGLGSGSAPATFAAPGPGRWSVQVALRFADDLGSATYYWDLTVR